MKYIIGIIIAAALLFAGWSYYSSSQNVPAPQVEAGVPIVGDTVVIAQNGAEAEPASAAQAAGVTVSYTSGGFSPKTVTIKKGENVTFMNESGGRMWVASGPHPAHTGYAGTSRAEHCPDAAGTAFDQCDAGDSYSFTFGQSGTWKYHNHVSAQDTGTIVVE